MNRGAERETYTVTCDLCDGTGQRFDTTCVDKVNAGPFAHQCSRCSGRGTRTLVRLNSGPSAAELGALPEWDDTQSLADWWNE